MEQLRWRAAAVAAVLLASGALIAARPARLGLRGGTQITLEAVPAGGQKVDGDTVGRTLEVLRQRVDQLGVAEPTLQRSGDRRIIVELPGLKDPEQAVAVIGQTAQLEFRPVLAVGAPDASTTTIGPPPTDDALTLPDEDGGNLRLGPPALTGEGVATARAVFPGGGWQVEVDFRGGGRTAWETLTGQAACAPSGDPTRRIAITLDQKVISSPEVALDIPCRQGITGGTTVITGSFTQSEAKELALLIRAGALPVPVEIVEQRTVGPTLGQAAVSASVKAAVIGAALTILYMSPTTASSAPWRRWRCWPTAPSPSPSSSPSTPP